MTWPLPWNTDTTTGVGAAVPAPGRPFPPPRWPSKAQLDYTQQAILVGLLVLALPWLIGKLVTNPGDVLSAAGRGAVRKAGS